MNKLICYARLSRLCATQAFDGGVVYVLGGYALRAVRLILLLLIWRSLLENGADAGGMALPQVLTYTLISAVLGEQLDIVTPATTAFWEGSLLSRYTRPLALTAQLMAETVGRWLPALALYSLPMLAAAPLLGVNPWPSSAISALLFLPSLLLAVSLGFAMDFLFAALAVWLKNASWMAHTIRGAIMHIFSGGLIPFVLLPWGVGGVLALLPFGSLAGAPLAIYVGSGSAAGLLGMQLLWNALLWPAALVALRKSQERMVSYGG